MLRSLATLLNDVGTVYFEIHTLCNRFIARTVGVTMQLGDSFSMSGFVWLQYSKWYPSVGIDSVGIDSIVGVN